MKLDFPTDDVVKNVRYFLSTVKKATGNQVDGESVRQGQGIKPGTVLYSK